ncbi:transcription factor bHLH153-like [Solanum dulcamara]|uniref:transcription factor bHLH153-like n=1 Tax=Solanum dulcamara TaxID=45834 RepID=UPI0024858D85|nr:transcription factor bHLH153-like [Solanum dulcamara]
MGSLTVISVDRRPLARYVQRGEAKEARLDSKGVLRIECRICVPKEKKEKFGERIVALQQLVSPYGKTDTASVLLEAMGYIKFLHKQVKVLSAPYLGSIPMSKTQESQPYNLRSQGLCLVPVSYTVGVASSNGADIWAPIKTSQKF